MHDLFEHTDLRVNLTTALTQDIAEGRFNENDRDRLDSGANVKIGTQWPNGFDVGLVFDARRTEDVAIRSSRSANNSIKETYEINPSYGWNLSRWINLDQNFRVWIQYTDYVYSDLEEVNKQDDFNKRGNLETKLTLTPNRRLRVVLSHNYNIKLNGKKTNTNAAGYSYYFRESDQRINKLNVAINYKVYDWFRFEATTFKGRDLKESFGTTTRRNRTLQRRTRHRRHRGQEIRRRKEPQGRSAEDLRPRSQRPGDRQGVLGCRYPTGLEVLRCSFGSVRSLL